MEWSAYIINYKYVEDNMVPCDRYFNIFHVYLGPPYSSRNLHKAVQQGDAELVVSILKSKFVTVAG